MGDLKLELHRRGPLGALVTGWVTMVNRRPNRVLPSFWPSLAGEDNVEVAVEKDSAFRRAIRRCGTQWV